MLLPHMIVYTFRGKQKYHSRNKGRSQTSRLISKRRGYIYSKLKKGGVDDRNSVQRIIIVGIIKFITQGGAITERLVPRVFELEADLTKPR